VSPAPKPPLRIGLLLDGVKLSRFFAKIVEDIRASNFARLELLVFKKASPSAKPEHKAGPKAFRALNRVLDSKMRKRLLYDEYVRLDKRMKASNHPLDQVDCSEMFAGVDRIEVEPIGKKFIHRFPDDALQQIRAKNLDVILRFGFNILHGDILNVARYGVWSYHHGDNDFYRGGPPHFWEIYEGAPLSGVILQVLTEELDAGVVLCKSLFATEQTLSVSRNRYPAYWGATDLVIRKLNELHQFGWDYLKQRSVAPEPYQGKRKIYRTPSNWDMARWLGPALLRKVVRYPLRREVVQHWRIGIRLNATKLLWEGGPSENLDGFGWIEPPKGHFWADPFLVHHAGRPWLFFEDYSYAQKRAVISCAEIIEQGNLGIPVTCLDVENHHFSYPHIFQAGSDFYMIPESCDSKSIDLYRCEHFPNRWVHEATLFDGRFVDTTVWREADRWWLTTTRAEPDARSGTLFLFSSEVLTGEWQMHPCNPISTDIRSNRGAGRVFHAGNHLIRPSQSCSPIYGYSFSLNEITELSPEKYTQRLLKTVTPEYWKGLCAVHTYNVSGNVEVIDGATMTPRSQV